MSAKSLKDLLVGSQRGENAPAVDDVTLAGQCPLLYILLTQTTSPTKGKRQVCTLNIFADGGVWKVCLRERDRGQVLWAACEELAGLPGALERLLEEEEIPWRAVRPYSSGRGG